MDCPVPQTRSMIIAMPWPTPMHIITWRVAAPLRRALQFVAAGGDQAGAAHAEQVAQAMAPPLGFYGGASSSARPRSRSTAKGPGRRRLRWSSMTSIWSSEAGLGQHLRPPARRAEAHDARRHAGGGHADDAGARVRPCFAGGGVGGQQQRAAPSLTPEALPAVTLTVPAVDALQLGQHLERGFGARMLVGVEDDRVALLLRGMTTGTSSSAKRPAAWPRPSAAGSAAGEGVLVGARDVEPRRRRCPRSAASSASRRASSSAG